VSQYNCAGIGIVGTTTVGFTRHFHFHFRDRHTQTYSTLQFISHLFT